MRERGNASEIAVTQEFFCVEFQHPVRGWILLPDLYPFATFHYAQDAIARRLVGVPKSKYASVARAYQIVRYVRQEPNAVAGPTP